MKNLKRGFGYLFIVTLVMLFVGCGSIYNYTVEPTPIKKGEAKYALSNFELKLLHGHGRNLENKTFKNEEELKDSFVSFINQELKNQNLQADNDGYKVSIKMDYTRTYNYGGNALNKPIIEYTVEIVDKNNQLLVTYGWAKHTTKYAYFDDTLVNAKIALYQWMAEDEPKDIKLISELIVRDLKEIGK